MTRAGAGAVLFAAAVAAGACGYSLVGKGVIVDPSIRRIGVPLFKDDTGKPGLDQKITQKVIEELLKRGHFDVVQEATGVDALIEGEILNYNSTPIGFSEQGTAQDANTQASRYAIVLTARVKYAKVGASEPIWENDAFAAHDEYDVGDSSSTFFDREDQAIDRLSKSFAQSLVAAMLEAF
jgi:hypothetical protein